MRASGVQGTRQRSGLGLDDAMTGFRCAACPPALGSPLPCLAAEELAHVVVLGESRPVASRLEEARKRVAEKKWPEAVALLQSVIESSPNDLVSVGKDRAVAARAGGPGDPGPERPGVPRPVPQAGRVAGPAPARGGRRGVGPAPRRGVVLQHAGRRGPGPPRRSRLPGGPARRGRGVVGDGRPARAGRPRPMRWPTPTRRRRPWRGSAPSNSSRGSIAASRAGRRCSTPTASATPTRPGRSPGRSGKYADILAACAKGLAARAERSGLAHLRGRSLARRGRGPADDLPGRLGRLCRGGPTWTFDLARAADARDLRPRRGAGDRRGGAAAGVPPRRRRHDGPGRRRAIRHRVRPADGQGERVVRRGGDRRRHEAAPGAARRGGPPLHADRRGGLRLRRMGSQTVRDIRPDPRRPAGRSAPRSMRGESVLVSLSLKPGADGDRRRWHVAPSIRGGRSTPSSRGHPSSSRAGSTSPRRGSSATRSSRRSTATPPTPRTRPPRCSGRRTCARRANCCPPGTPPVRRQRTRHHLLTVTGSTVVYCSHSGVVAALDPRTGRRVWARSLPQRDDREPEDEPRLRDLAPAVFAEGKLYVAPADSDRLFCLDPASGETIWHRDGMDVGPPARRRLGAADLHRPGATRNRARSSPAASAPWTPAPAATDAAGACPTTAAASPRWAGANSSATSSCGRRRGKPYGVFAVRQEDGRQPDNPALLHRIPSGNLVYRRTAACSSPTSASCARSCRRRCCRTRRRRR